MELLISHLKHAKNTWFKHRHVFIFKFCFSLYLRDYNPTQAIAFCVDRAQHPFGSGRIRSEPFRYRPPPKHNQSC